MIDVGKKFVFIITKNDKKVVASNLTDLVNFTTEDSVMIETMELATVIDRGRVITGKGFVIEKVEMI